MRCFSSASNIPQLLLLSAPLHTLAQDTGSGIPTCAVNCYETAVSAVNCGVDDFECQCTKAVQTSSTQLNSCIAAACSPADVAQFESVVIETCAAFGISSAALGFPTIGPTPGSSQSKPSATLISGNSPTAAQNAATTGNSAPTGSQHSGSGSKPNVGLIVGVVVGGLGLLAFIAGAILFCLSRRKRRAQAITPPHMIPPQLGQPYPVQKTELHSESLPVNVQGIPQGVPQNTATFNATTVAPVYIKTELSGNQVNEIQGQPRNPASEIQGAEAGRPAQPAELDADWDWVAGKPRNSVMSPSV